MTQPPSSQPAASGTAVLCPKCSSQMLPLQRFGVEIDQCTGCGGIFLDRGELEVLAQAEANFYAAAQPPPQPPQQYASPQPTYQPYPQPTYQQGGFLGAMFGGGHHDGHHGRRRGHH